MGNIQAIELVKVIVMVSVFYVWVVRYKNIIQEFKFYNLPDWLRDLVGIVKLISVYLINFSTPELSKLGALAIVVLMGAAMFTHLRVKNPIYKMLPSTVLASIGIYLYFNL